MRARGKFRPKAGVRAQRLTPRTLLLDRLGHFRYQILTGLYRNVAAHVNESLPKVAAYAIQTDAHVTGKADGDFACEYDGLESSCLEI